MSAKARARGATQRLPLWLFIGFVAVSIVATGATAVGKSPAVAPVSGADTVAAVGQMGPSQPTIVASLVAPTLPLSNIGGIQTAMPPGSIKENIQLASIDSTATPELSSSDRNQEPFGLSSFAAPDNIVWFKWRKVIKDIHAQEPALMRCLADEAVCSRAEAHFTAIIKEAREHEGRVQFNFVNQRINNAIRYTNDMTQWGTPDEWSAPLADGKGSFETGMGDCEDYAIAKYVALRAAGVPTKYLRVLLVRDNIARLDHAVLAASEDGHWFILDNRWTAAVEDNDVHRFTPLLALDDRGLRLLVAPYASRTEPVREAVKSAGQKLPASAETAQAQSSQNDIGALGLRPSIL